MYKIVFIVSKIIIVESVETDIRSWLRLVDNVGRLTLPSQTAK